MYYEEVLNSCELFDYELFEICNQGNLAIKDNNKNQLQFILNFLIRYWNLCNINVKYNYNS